MADTMRTELFIVMDDGEILRREMETARIAWANFERLEKAGIKAAVVVPYDKEEIHEKLAPA